MISSFLPEIHEVSDTESPSLIPYTGGDYDSNYVASYVVTGATTEKEEHVEMREYEDRSFKGKT